jgi:hypothetical protein
MNKRLSEHRKTLKYELLSRDEFCLACGVQLIQDVNIDLHEGLISKAQMMGLSIDKKIQLHAKENCINTCHYCNINCPPTREKVWWTMCKWYGVDHMIAWYEQARSLFKAPPPRFYSIS